jgi:hypothetical protein
VSAGNGHFAYSQARLQARFGQSADPADLQRAHAARDLAGFLSAVRTTAQRRYSTRLAPGMDAHELERHLRYEWSVLVDEVARWQPTPWQEAIRWLRWLPYLPALQKLTRGGRPPAWARADPVLGRIVAIDPALRGAALAASPLQPFRLALEADAGDVTAAWLDHWRALWPEGSRHAHALDLIARDVALLDAKQREAVGGDSRELHGALSRRLLRAFRRYPLSPTAAVAYLGLEALGLLGLRGGVMRRAVVVPGPA